MDTHMHICEFVSGYTNECLEAKQPCDLVICVFLYFFTDIGGRPLA